MVIQSILVSLAYLSLEENLCNALSFNEDTTQMNHVPLIHTFSLVLYYNCELLNKSNRTHTYLLTHSLALSPTDSHSSLPVTFCHHLLTFNSHRSFSLSSNHLNLGFAILLLPSGLLPNTILTTLP